MPSSPSKRNNQGAMREKGAKCAKGKPFPVISPVSLFPLVSLFSPGSNSEPRTQNSGLSTGFIPAVPLTRIPLYPHTPLPPSSRLSCHLASAFPAPLTLLRDKQKNGSGLANHISRCVAGSWSIWVLSSIRSIQSVWFRRLETGQTRQTRAPDRLPLNRPSPHTTLPPYTSRRSMHDAGRDHPSPYSLRHFRQDRRPFAAVSEWSILRL